MAKLNKIQIWKFDTNFSRWDWYFPAIMTTCWVSLKKNYNLSSKKNMANKNKTFLLNDFYFTKFHNLKDWEIISNIQV